MRRTRNSPDFRSSPPVLRIGGLFVAASLMLVACGADSAPSSMGRPAVAPSRVASMSTPACGATARARAALPTVSVDEEDLVIGARDYAGEIGVSVEEARRRLLVIGSLGGLRAKLEAAERDTFAGLWWQHQPEFRLIVAFTRDGEETICPYIEGEPYEGIVEVRRVEATHAELLATREETQRLLDRLRGRLDREVIANIHTSANRIEIPIVHRDQFDDVLRESGIRLPEHVAVIAEGDRSLEPGRGRATAVSPRPATQIQLPTGEAEEPGGPSTQVPLSSELVERHGCCSVTIDLSTARRVDPTVAWPRAHTENMSPPRRALGA